MYHVTGTIDAVPYRVGIHPEGIDEPDAVGVVMGSVNALTAIEAYVGAEVQATPTSDPIVVDMDNAESVHAFLLSHTAVGSIEGDVPVLVGDDHQDGDVH